MASAPSTPQTQNLIPSANATALGNKQAVEAATNANRTNQTNANGSVKWTSTDVFDNAGYQAALDSWKASGGKIEEMPNKALFTSKQWSSQEVLNPELQRTLANQQAAGATLSNAASFAAQRAAQGLSGNYSAPKSTDYLKNVGSVDTSKISAPQFNWDANGATSGAGQIQDFKSQVGNFDTSAKIDINPTSTAQKLNQNGVGTVDGFNYTGPKTNTSFDAKDNINTDLAGQLAKNGVDTSYKVAPLFNNNRQDQYMRAAYDAQMSLLQPEMDRQLQQKQNRLELQGLGVDSEAMNGAMSTFLNSQAAQKNQIVNQSVLTGNQLSNADYASALSGFNADRASQNQSFNQNKTVFDGTNSANQQKFQNELTRFDANNSSQAQDFSQSNQTFQNKLNTATTNQSLIDSQNAQRTQQLTNDLATFQAKNAAAGQQLGLDQTKFNSNLAATQANQAIVNQNNASQQARYNQLYQNWQSANNLSQQSFTDQVASQNQANQTQSQALAQALQKFQLAQSDYDTSRYGGLKDYQALVQGSSPVSANNQYQSFAQQGTYAGPDILGATQGNNNQLMAQYQAGVNQANSTNSALANLGSTAASLYFMAPSDKRLKTNIKTVGETDSGRTVKSWDWNKKAQRMGLSGSSMGVIAQENQDIATTDKKTGLMAVDYSKVHTPKAPSTLQKLANKGKK